MTAFDAAIAAEGVRSKLEQCAVILERAATAAYGVHLMAGGGACANAVLYACRVDLREACLMFDACQDMVRDAMEAAERARAGFAGQ